MASQRSSLELDQFTPYTLPLHTEHVESLISSAEGSILLDSAFEISVHTRNQAEPVVEASHHAEHSESLINSAEGSILEPTFEGSTDTRKQANSVAVTPRHRKVKTFRTEGWLCEILSLLMACASLIGFMFLLKKYDNQASPQWPHGLSLNTAVSVMSTLFRINVLVAVAAGISQMGWVWLARRERRLDDVACFDAASRGPWGCFRLLGRTRLG